MQRRGTYTLIFIIALAIGIAFPYLELAWKCREGLATSEACVWGRAYLPLGRWLEPLIITPIAFVIISIVGKLVRRRPIGGDE
jgi:hypothetical protein